MQELRDKSTGYLGIPELFMPLNFAKIVEIVPISSSTPKSAKNDLISSFDLMPASV